MVKTKNILLILLVVFGVIIVLSFSNLFSLMSIDKENYPTCEIGMEGGFCDLYLELSAGEMVDKGYSFDIRTKPVPETEFKDRQQLTLTGQAGPFRENRATYTNNWWEVEHELFLFEVPNSWIDVYEYKLEYQSTSQASARTYNEGYAYLEMFIGFVTIPYMSKDPIVCNSYDTRWCRDNIPNYIVQSSFDEGQWNYRDYQTNFLSKPSSLLSARASDGTVRMTMSGEKIMSGANLPKTDRKVLIKTEQELTDYGSTIGMTRTPQITFPKPPNVFASYKQNHYLTNLKVNVGSETVYYKQGKLDEGLLFLPDISNAVNDFCGRIDEDNQRDADCIIRMRFESDNAGIIQVIGDLGELKQTIPIDKKDDENSFTQPKFTGYAVFDFKDNPVSSFATVGFLLVLLSLIVYFIRGGKF